MSLHLFLPDTTACSDKIPAFRRNLKKIINNNQSIQNNTISAPCLNTSPKLCFGFQGFNWTRFIQGVLSSVSIQVLLEEEVVVYSSPYLEKMNEVLPKHSVRLV